MVNITRTDLGLLLGMFFTVWVLTTFFSMAGLASEDFNASDPPTLNLSDNDVDVIPDPPGPPLGQNQYRISDDTDETHPRVLDLNSTSFVSVRTCSQLGYSGCLYNVQMTLGPSGTGNADLVDEANFTDNGTQKALDYDGTSDSEEWRVLVEMENNQTGQVKLTVQRRPPATGFIGTIVGTVEAAQNAIASALGTFVNIVATVNLVVINTIAEVLVLSGKVGAFAVSYVGYLFGGYLSITTSAASGWATPVLLAPLVVLSFEMFKFGLATIEAIDPLIPLT